MLIQANALRIPLAEESVHMCVTSPPYWGLRSYEGQQSFVWSGDPECSHEWEYFERQGMSGGPSDKQESNVGSWHEPTQQATCQLCGAWYGALGLEPTPELYVQHIVEVFREVKRVLRRDGVLFLNLGDSYATHASKRSAQFNGDITDGRNDIFTKAKTPAHVYGLKEKDLCMIPARVALALQADGWWVRSDIIWSKPNPMPESVTDRPTKSHEYLFLLAKSANYFYDADSIREGVTGNTHDRGTKLSPPKEAKNTADGNGHKDWTKYTPDPVTSRNRRTVWHIATAPYSGAHFATYPPALVEPCIKAGTSERGCCPNCGKQWVRVTDHEPRPANEERIARLRAQGVRSRQSANLYAEHKPNTYHTLGFRPSCTCGLDPIPCTVFDPFVGSGTTLLVARQLGRRAIGLDLSAEYLQLARERLSLDKLDAWTNGVPAKDTTLLDLPMFTLSEASGFAEREP